MYTMYIAEVMGERKRSPKRKGARFNLSEPWDGKLADFCAAHFAGSATEVVRAALDVFIPEQLNRDRATAERYEKLQAERTKQITGDPADAKESQEE